MEAGYAEKFNKLKAELAKFVALTSDENKDDLTKIKYTSMTVHYLKEHKLQSKILELYILEEEQYTSDKIRIVLILIHLFPQRKMCLSYNRQCSIEVISSRFTSQ